MMKQSDNELMERENYEVWEAQESYLSKGKSTKKMLKPIALVSN